MSDDWTEIPSTPLTITDSVRFVEIPDPEGHPFAFNVDRLIAVSPLSGEQLKKAQEQSPDVIAWVLLEDGIKVATTMPYEDIITLISEVALIVRAAREVTSETSGGPSHYGVSIAEASANIRRALLGDDDSR
jgi:hypothetical protein